MKATVPIALLCAAGLAAGPAAPAPTVTLENAKLRVVLNAADGALLQLENRLTGVSQSVRSVPFHLVTSRGDVWPRDCRLAGRVARPQNLVFTFAGQGLRIEQGYHLVSPTGNAVEISLKVTNRGRNAVTLQTITMADWQIPAAYGGPYPHSYDPGGINQILFHRSGLWDDHPINLFLRDERGSVFLGIENPFWNAQFVALRKVYPASVRISYDPRWMLRPGESFEGDHAFFGVCRHEGVYAVRPIRVFFGGRERLPPEIMDWGEVWGMQEFMRAIMPHNHTPTGEYPMSYWGLVDPGRLGTISRKQQKGERLTAEEATMLRHFGGGPFTTSEQELWYRLTPETVRIYKQAVDDAASLGHFDTLIIPNLWAGNQGWFVSPEQKKHGVPVGGDDWFGRPAFPAWQEVADYAGKKGLGMFTLELATNGEYRKDRPDLKYLDRDGKRVGGNCYANREYAHWYTDRVDLALRTQPIRHWQWDEGWIGGMIGQEAECWDTHHGHLPGRVGYHQFRNVLETLRTLKQRHPKVRLVIISGLIPGMPWLMRYMDEESHTGSFDPAAWMDHNNYFLPPSRSHRRGAMAYLVGNGSPGAEAQPAEGWYSMLEDPARRKAYQEHWDRWMRWANQHQVFLERRRDLFLGEGVPGWLEGSAHCIEDRGFLFLHNSTSEAKAACISLDSRLGLEKGELFQIDQLYPREQALGQCRRGEALTLAVEPGQTLLLQIEPALGPARGERPAVPASLPVQKPFLSLDEVIRLLEPADFWPALPLPGTGNMPHF
jgi:hypothetical protein